MRHALALARRGLGRVWPNPAVGCIIVDPHGRVCGRGVTQPGGRPHAETEALRQAGLSARGGTVYVTLEPCSHTGQTGPCVEALIHAGIARAVIAVVDPDRRVAGRGIARLEAAGIAVTVGLCEDAARALNRGYLMRVANNRPFVTVKLASSLDGRIALASGESRWITSQSARERVHRLRAGADAVLTGAQTVLADDPSFTVRLAGLEARSPLVIVLDSKRQVLAARDRLKLFRETRRRPVWLFCPPSDDRHGTANPDSADAAVRMFERPLDTGGRFDLSDALDCLGGQGIGRLLVEAGGRLAGTLARADLIDELIWFQAPSLLGADAIPAIEALGLGSLGVAPRFAWQETICIGAGADGGLCHVLKPERPPRT